MGMSPMAPLNFERGLCSKQTFLETDYSSSAIKSSLASRLVA